LWNQFTDYFVFQKILFGELFSEHFFRSILFRRHLISALVFLLRSIGQRIPVELFVLCDLDLGGSRTVLFQGDEYFVAGTLDIFIPVTLRYFLGLFYPIDDHPFGVPKSFQRLPGSS
jgi:hypothetical protein